MDSLRLVIAGPGRAGVAIGLAATRRGHNVVAVVGRDRDHAAAAAEALDALSRGGDESIPSCDLLVIAVRDDAITELAAGLAPLSSEVAGAVHLSGLTPVAALAPLANRGIATGSLHPLQTLPTPEAGAGRIAGAWMAVTATDPLRTRLHAFATSMGASPFDLADEAKPLYHAAASAAANFPLADLTMAHDLFESAGVPFEAARPLVEAVVANAFSLGPRAALTGPVARGDVETVAAQIDAVAGTDPRWLRDYLTAVAQLARLTGRSPEFEDVIIRAASADS